MGIPEKAVVWVGTCKHEAVWILWCLKSKQGVMIDEITEKWLDQTKNLIYSVKKLELFILWATVSHCEVDIGQW